jgi:hypothetical protein
MNAGLTWGLGRPVAGDTGTITRFVQPGFGQYQGFHPQGNASHAVRPVRETSSLGCFAHSAAMHGVTEVFKCPADKDGLFARDGSSYQWNTSFDGRMVIRMGEDSPDEARAFLLRDRKAWHLSAFTLPRRRGKASL